MASMGLISIVLWFVGIVMSIVVVVAVFEIRSASLRAADRLDDIYHFLKEEKES